MTERFYENYEPQCQQRCIVGELGRAKVCICEFVQGHDGQCERIPTTRLAGVKEFDTLSWYRKFI
jgi:hypothetical protein